MKDFKLFKKKIYKKNIAVLGFGVSNRPLVKLLIECGAYVTVFDEKKKLEQDEAYEEFKDLGVNFKIGDNSFVFLKEEFFNYLFRSPGIRHDLEPINFAKKKGSIVTSEMEIFFKYCKALIIAVTGSDGKTTTSSIIYEILKKAGFKTRIGGNIGNPLIYEIEKIDSDEKIVVELSSFQLQSFTDISPKISIITNISPNHLNWHKNYNEYVKCKENIFLHQNKNSLLVTNYDDLKTRDMVKKTLGNVLYFSLESKLKTGVFIKDQCIYYKKNGVERKILSTFDILLKGKHNIKNYMAAIAALGDLAKKEDIEFVAKNFTGVKHRAEFVREFLGVKYYNSSIDSSPDRTVVTLSIFKKKVILICGGQDKGISYEKIGKTIFEKVKCLILIGKTSNLIEKSFKNYLFENKKKCLVKIFRCQNYIQVVETSKNISKPGDVVLLSPASTSFDMFENFKERGDLFKKLVNEL